MRILLTGRTGQLGHELERALGAAHEVVALDRAALDLARLETIGPTVARVAPEVIVNAAAYTAVERAEREREQAFRLNSMAVRLLGEAALARGALLVHYSTDYVFDGTKAGAYTEDDPPNPINLYG